MCAPFAWERECKHAFNILKMALCNAVVIALLDPNAKYCLHVNPCQNALGAVLSEVNGQAEQVLGYSSCKLHHVVT
jgi:hypothetical protein